MLIGSMFEQLACCIYLYVFFPSLKTPFLLARQLLNKSLTDLHLSSPFSSCLDRSYHFLDPQKISRLCHDSLWTASLIHRETFCLADRFSTDSQSIEVSGLLLDTASTNNLIYQDPFVVNTYLFFLSSLMHFMHLNLGFHSFQGKFWFFCVLLKFLPWVLFI